MQARWKLIDVVNYSLLTTQKRLCDFYISTSFLELFTFIRENIASSSLIPLFKINQQEIQIKHSVVMDILASWKQIHLRLICTHLHCYVTNLAQLLRRNWSTRLLIRNQ
jgi:hypothetical protein